MLEVLSWRGNHWTVEVARLTGALERNFRKQPLHPRAPAPPPPPSRWIIPLCFYPLPPLRPTPVPGWPSEGRLVAQQERGPTEWGDGSSAGHVLAAGGSGCDTVVMWFDSEVKASHQMWSWVGRNSQPQRSLHVIFYLSRLWPAVQTPRPPLLSASYSRVSARVCLPEKKPLVRRKLTLSLRMESLSRLAMTSSEKGSRLARRSSSEFRRSRWRLDGLDLAPSVGAGLTLEMRVYRTQHKCWQRISKNKD